MFQEIKKMEVELMNTSKMKLGNIVKNDYKIYEKNISNKSAVYIFWYDNRDRQINNLKRIVTIHGPSKIEQEIEWNWQLQSDFICLYIGKTTKIRNRIRGHLHLRDSMIYNKDQKHIKKITTSSQLRSGFEFLYLRQPDVDIRKEMLERVFLSYLRLDSFVDRFYLEDYLIGKYLPWFNLDSER